MLSPSRLVCILLTIAAGLWIAAILPAEIVRYRNAPVMKTVHAGKAVPPAVLDAAIADTEWASGVSLCSTGPLTDLGTLHATKAFAGIRAGARGAAQRHLAAARTAFVGAARCSPLRSEVWLNLAQLSLRAGGITADAVRYYKLSAYTAPREAWAAERRVQAAIRLASLFDEEARQIVKHDLRILESAMEPRRKRLLDRTNMASFAELRAYFDQQ